MSKKIYRSMQGKVVDIDAMRNKNELTIAVGNADMNARGDKLGPGGKILKKREEVVAEYYEDNPVARPKQNIPPPPPPPPPVTTPKAEVKKK